MPTEDPHGPLEMVPYSARNVKDDKPSYSIEHNKENKADIKLGLEFLVLAPTEIDWKLFERVIC